MTTTPPARRATLAIVDTETVSLDRLSEIWEVGLQLRTPASQIIAGHEVRTVNVAEYEWLLPVDLSKANPMSLAMNGFHDRFDLDKITPLDAHWCAANDLPGHGNVLKTSPAGNALVEGFADEFARLTLGALMIGAVPSFDEERLWHTLHRHGQMPMWHYQPIDVETLAAGYLLGQQTIVASLDGGALHDGALGYFSQSEIDRFARGAELAANPPWDSEALSRAVGIEPNDFARHSSKGDVQWAGALYDVVMGAVDD